MPTPDQGALFPLPKVNDAPHLCVTLSIPGDQESISNFVGALSRLALWNNYRRDPDKRGKEIAQVWKGIIESIEFDYCKPAPLPDGGCGCGDDCMCCLRVENGVLQTLQCGVWTDVPGGDLKAIAGLGVQQPAPGGTLELNDCASYDVTLFGSNVYNLPIAVSEGYVIKVTEATGGWSDGDVVGPFGAAWSCPNGSVYALGGCGAANPPDGGDPLPSVAHMRLIASIGGDYIDGYGMEYTIPPGVTDVPVTFQANDAAIGNNLGSITFHVEICNKPVATWAKGWNFLAESGPFVPEVIGGVDYAQWLPGIGWANITPGSAISMVLKLIPPAGVYTHIELDVISDIAVGNFSAGIDSEVLWPATVPVTATYVWDGSHTNPTIIEFNPSGTPNTSHCYFTGCRMSGQGPSPF